MWLRSDVTDEVVELMIMNDYLSLDQSVGYCTSVQYYSSGIFYTFYFSATFYFQ